MFGKRLALGALLTSLGVAAFGGFSNSSGQSSQTGEPGLTYGGLRNVESVWLRLDQSRRVILAVEVPWEAPRKRCSDKRPYASTVFTGAEYVQPVVIAADGTFARRVVDRYREEGIRYVETQNLKGTLTDAKVTGTIAGKAKATKPNGKVVRCSFGPQNWSAVD